MFTRLFASRVVYHDFLNTGISPDTKENEGHISYIILAVFNFLVFIREFICVVDVRQLVPREVDIHCTVLSTDLSMIEIEAQNNTFYCG